MSFFNFSNKSASSSSKKPGSSSKDPKILPKDYAPKRFGLRYDPPTISNINHLFFSDIFHNSPGIYASREWETLSS